MNCHNGNKQYAILAEAARIWAMIFTMNTEKNGFQGILILDKSKPHNYNSIGTKVALTSGRSVNSTYEGNKLRPIRKVSWSMIQKGYALQFYRTNRIRIAVFILAVTVAAFGCLFRLLPEFIVKFGEILFLKGSCFEIFIN